MAIGGMLRTLREVKTPVRLMLDKAGLLKEPYVLRTRDGFRILVRPGSGDRFIACRALVHRTHLSEGQKLNRGGVVIDVGANIGAFTILAARHVGPSGRVIAIEPEAGNYKQLVANVALNEPAGVETHQLAVGAREGTVQLRTGVRASLASFYAEVDHHRQDGQVQDVRMRPLEALMDEARIDRCDLLKLDCEGAEYDILFNMQPSVAERIAQISLEAHKVEGRHPQELGERLRTLGYQVRPGPIVMFAWR
jgi:FkbM family methyltransferase